METLFYRSVGPIAMQLSMYARGGVVQLSLRRLLSNSVKFIVEDDERTSAGGARLLSTVVGLVRLVLFSTVPVQYIYSMPYRYTVCYNMFNVHVLQYTALPARY